MASVISLCNNDVLVRFHAARTMADGNGAKRWEEEWMWKLLTSYISYCLPSLSLAVYSWLLSLSVAQRTEPQFLQLFIFFWVNLIKHNFSRFCGVIFFHWCLVVVISFRHQHQLVKFGCNLCNKILNSISRQRTCVVEVGSAFFSYTFVAWQEK